MLKKSISLLLSLLLVFTSTVALATDSAEPTEYSITLLTLGGGVVEASQSWATPGTTIRIMASPQTGYVFYNWTTDDPIVLDSEINYVTTFVMPAQNVSITANFTINPLLGGITGGNSGSAAGSDYSDIPAGATTYIIDFDTQGGSYVEKITVVEGETANAPTPPTCDGYVFTGWTTDPFGKQPFDFTSKIYGSMTLYAQWIPASQAQTFTDLGGYPWAKDAIYNLFYQGIINGTSATTYAPGKNITRADFITLIVRAFGFKVDFSENFADVPTNAYYYNAVGIAKELGIATGVSKDRFNPTAPITRQDIMVIIKRATEKAGINLTSTSYPAFSDISAVSAYAVDAVNLLTQAEIITGTNGKINPKNNATRAEVAVILDRLLQK